MSDDRVLVLDGLGKDFGATVALEALTCQVNRGEIVGLLGPTPSWRRSWRRSSSADGCRVQSRASWPPLLVLGVVCGILYTRSRSVAPCVLAHATYFGVSLAARHYLGVP